MIKNYKIFKESLLNHLSGPSFDEVINNISAFRFKINSKEEFCEYLEYFMNKKILGDKITIGTYMDDYIHYEYDKTYYKKYFLELCVSIEPIRFALEYKESFGKYNILVSIITESEINSGDVCKFILDDTSRIDDIINILIKKSERIVDWSRDEEFGYENDDDEITESLLNKLEGPSKEELEKNVKNGKLLLSELFQIYNIENIKIDYNEFIRLINNYDRPPTQNTDKWFYAGVYGNISILDTLIEKLPNKHYLIVYLYAAYEQTIANDNYDLFLHILNMNIVKKVTKYCYDMGKRIDNNRCIRYIDENNIPILNN